MTGGTHLKDIVRGASVALVLKVSGAALGFLLSLALARILGAHNAGLYFLALSVVTLASVVARLGLDHSTVRSVSRYLSLGRHRDLMDNLYSALRVGFVVSTVVALTIALSAATIADRVFDEPALTPILRWMAFAVIPLTQMYTYAQALNGLGRIVYGQLVDGLAMPLLNLLGMLALAPSFGTLGATASLLTATGLTALLGARFWARSRQSSWPTATRLRWSYVADSMKSFWLSGMLNQGVLPLAPTLLLGLWVSAADVGVYGIASRVAFVLGFLLLALRPAVSAKFSAMEAQQDFKGMRRLHLKVMLLMFGLVAMPAVLLVLFPETVLGIFGQGFERGRTVLPVLVAAQVVNVALGVSGYILLMTGQALTFSKVSAFSAFLLVVLSLLLVPRFGILGMAYTVLAVSLVGQSLPTWLAFKAYSEGGRYR